MILGKNTTVLDILKAGGSVTLPSGYGFSGDPVSKYIDLRLPEDGSDGLCLLTEEGLAEAYAFAAKYEEEVAADDASGM